MQLAYGGFAVVVSFRLECGIFLISESLTLLLEETQYCGVWWSTK
jgi:hypothetical protein